MGNEVICKKCSNIMVNKGQIEDPETGSEIKYKHMHYCSNCDSYIFTAIGNQNSSDNTHTDINSIEMINSVNDNQQNGLKNIFSVLNLIMTEPKLIKYTINFMLIISSLWIII